MKETSFVMLDRKLLRSDAVTGLSARAFRLMIDLAYCYTGRNNGEIRYGIAQAAKLLHCGRRTAITTFAELKAAGLIEATQCGSFVWKTGSRKGTATAWRLTFLK